MKYGWILVLSILVASCIGNRKEDQFYVLNVIVENGIPNIESVTKTNMVSTDVPILKKGISLYQIGLWETTLVSNTPSKELFALPELYLQDNTSFKCALKYSNKNIKLLSLHYMDGSSGHFTLKNTQPVQIFSIDP